MFVTGFFGPTVRGSFVFPIPGLSPGAVTKLVSSAKSRLAFFTFAFQALTCLAFLLRRFRGWCWVGHPAFFASAFFQALVSSAKSRLAFFTFHFQALTCLTALRSLSTLGQTQVER